MIFAVTIVMLMATTALAADVTYGSTSYIEINGGEDLQITVNYSVSSYEAGEQVTMLVLTGTDSVQYDPDDPTVPTNIAYIDQQLIKADNGSFTFVLSKSFIENNRIYVKLGATKMLTADGATEPVITDGAVGLADVKAIVKEFVSGYDGTYACQGEEIKFKVDESKLASDIKFRVYNDLTSTWGEYQSLTPDGEGVYTIAGSAVTGNIEIEGTIIGANISGQLVTREQYKAIVAETADKQIFVLNGTSSQDTYKVNGKEMFWSPKYNAHVAFISSSETLKSLSTKITVTKGASATAIVYNGDINGDGKTTAADATIVKDCLYNQRNTATSDMQLFKLDVESNGDSGFMTVTTADIVRVLGIAVGK